MLRYGLPSSQPKSGSKRHLSDSHHQKDRAHDCVQSEKGHVDPVETAAAGDPMFQAEATHDEQPANDVGDAEAAEPAERKEQSTHKNMRQECRLQSVLRSP